MPSSGAEYVQGWDGSNTQGRAQDSSLALAMGNYVELIDHCQMVYSCCDPVEAWKLCTSGRTARRPHYKRVWQQRRERLLAEKIDVTPFVVEVVERYGSGS